MRPGSPKPLPGGVERVSSLLERGSIAGAAGDSDVVFHLAGTTRAVDLNGYREVNVTATREVGLAAREVGARLVHVSSQAAAGPGTRERPRTESEPPGPICDYGRSKLEGELAIRRIPGLRWSIVRPSAVYGPRDRDFPLLFRLAERGIFPLVGAANAVYSFLYVDDLVEALRAVAECDDALEEEFFVAHPESRSTAELMRLLAGIVQRQYRPVRIPRSILWLAMIGGRVGARLGADPAMTRSRFRQLGAGGYVCSPEKLRRMTGFEADVALEEGMARTWRWHAGRRPEGPGA